MRNTLKEIVERLRSKITINAKFEIRDRLSGFSGGWKGVP